MNLVAKEYVAARQSKDGVLILSQFTGASRELKQALIVNPYHADEVGEAILHALTMSRTEQYRRMHALRGAVRAYNVYRWAAEFIRAVVEHP